MCGPSTCAYRSTIASVLCPADALNGGQINGTFHQRHDRGVAYYVRRDELRIEPGAHHRLAEWLIHPCVVPRARVPLQRPALARDPGQTTGYRRAELILSQG